MEILSVTDLAIEKLKDVLKEEGQPTGALRVMVMPGAEGSMQYMLTLEQGPAEEDTVITSNGVTIVVDQDSVPFLEGAEIDYVEGLMRSGFTIRNPNAVSAGGCACGNGGVCGCGGSH